MAWTKADIPRLEGRICIVTGANAGIGLASALLLAGQGATVILACRNLDKAHAAKQKILAESPTADLRPSRLDLASMASIRSFASRMGDEFGRLDLLINNAGLMMPPFARTEDSFEMQFGTNYLGHFALTGLLLPLLQNAAAARVVTLSSIAHRFGRIEFDNLNSERRYSPWDAYARSKLACLIFAFELQRRLTQVASPVKSLAAHPGATRTDLGRYRVDLKIMEWLIAQESEAGAMPTLRAATDPALRGGEYFGPAHCFGLRGPAVLEKPRRTALDGAVAERLWTVSEQLAAFRYVLPATSSI